MEHLDAEFHLIIGRNSAFFDDGFNGHVLSKVDHAVTLAGRQGDEPLLALLVKQISDELEIAVAGNESPLQRSVEVESQQVNCVYLHVPSLVVVKLLFC
jgi:hypothetical protein